MTGLYYYGARYYSPRESFWFGCDPLMDKYPEWSPYAYCANNPIMYTDPTGMDIEFGKNERFLFKVKATVILTIGWLTSPTQRAQINQLRTSRHTHTIKESDGWNYAAPEDYSNYRAQRPIPDPTRIDDEAYNDVMDQKEKEWQEGIKDHLVHKNGMGGNSIIFLNLSKKVKGKTQVVSAGHEFRHATEIDRGTIITDRIRGIYQVVTGTDSEGNPVLGDAYPGKHERNAIAAQNRIAKESNRFRRKSKRAKIMKNYYEQLP